MPSTYIVVSVSTETIASNRIADIITSHLKSRSQGAICYTYNKNIFDMYSFCDGEQERIERVVEFAGESAGYGSLFWLFVLTPQRTMSDVCEPHYDEQIWIHMGRILNCLIKETPSYMQQISFWVPKGFVNAGVKAILGEKLKEYSEDLKELLLYVDSAEYNLKRLGLNSPLKLSFENRPNGGYEQSRMVLNESTISGHDRVFRVNVEVDRGKNDYIVFARITEDKKDYIYSRYFVENRKQD